MIDAVIVASPDELKTTIIIATNLIPVFLFLYQDIENRGIWLEQHRRADSPFIVSQEVVLFLVPQQQFGPLRGAVMLLRLQ